ncbi:MAG TPA: nitroreductase family protein [Miltoncostaeaceae bacterium]|nr:nitroreductase family protein [Miltoncostaeaceae bacterium]
MEADAPAGAQVAQDPLRTLASLRAVRRYTSDPVGDDVLDRILEAGRWTGSARNRQPWRVAVVRDPHARGELARLGAYAGHLADAPVALLLALDADAGGADGEFDVGRLAQTLMLAAAALGLGTCPVTFFPDANMARATLIAGLAPPWRVRTGIALGHPAPPAQRAGRPAIPTGRRPLSELRIDPPPG